MFDYIQYRKEYYLKNIDKFKDYYNENKDEIAARNKIYYEKNKIELRNKQRKYFHEYYLLHKEAIKEHNLNRYYQYCKENNITVKKRMPGETDCQILDKNIIISLSD